MRVSKEKLKEELEAYRRQNAERKAHTRQKPVQYSETGNPRRWRSGSRGLVFGCPVPLSAIHGQNQGSCASLGGRLISSKNSQGGEKAMEAIELIEKRIEELEDMTKLSLEGRGRLKELKGLKRELERR